jgi:hypothetical protein
MPTGQEWLRAFDRLGGRARLALVTRVLEEKPPEALAGGLGISVEAADVMLFRAAAELEAALAARSAGDVPPRAEAMEDAEERAAAAALARALDGGPEARRSGVERRLALCRALRADPEVKAALVLPPPPPPTLRERARRLVWVALVVAAAILYKRYWPG